MSQTLEQRSYTVPGMCCGHRRAAITGEIQRVGGVAAVEPPSARPVMTSPEPGGAEAPVL